MIEADDLMPATTWDQHNADAVFSALGGLVADAANSRLNQCTDLGRHFGLDKH